MSTAAAAIEMQSQAITPHAALVYSLLNQIPRGRITSYAALARAANSSPRAVGGTLKRNPYAPQVPCHRVVASNGFVGGYKGDWEKVPIGVNPATKLQLLEEEGVKFDERGYLKDQKVWWDAFKV